MRKILNTIKKIIPKNIFSKTQPTYHLIWSWFSDFIYKTPSNNLIVIGVTGTTGKTTSVYMIAKVLERAGFKVGYTSTAMFSDGNKEWLNDKKMTMIGRLFTQKMLRKMVDNKCHYAIIETTSEGIKQFRHRFINYDILVFTGLYPEHIESHGSFEKYKLAKGELFNHLKRCKTKYIDDQCYVHKVSGIKKIDFNRIKKTIIVNGDDENSKYFLSFLAEKKFAYTNKDKLFHKCDIIKYGGVNMDFKGVSFYVENTFFQLNILGKFNATNAMNAVCVAVSQGIDMKKIKEGLENIESIVGKLEKINVGQNFTAIVDYAFEPNALTKLYETIKYVPHKRIIHILGSTGGGRDVARRPKLGEIAGQNADIVIITNEDPYDDIPELIIDQIAIGAEKAGKEINKNLFKITDRRKAIISALHEIKKDDILLLTGKGSEQAICIANGEKIEWDDRKVLKDELINKINAQNKHVNQIM